MKSAALKQAMYEFERVMNKGNERFREFSESLHNDDIDEAYVLLDELISSFARIARMRMDLLAAIYDEEKMKLEERAEMQISICGRAPAIWVREDVDRLINNLKKTQEEAER